MGVEIEKKFLVKKERWNAVKGKGTPYRQGYMLRDEHKTIRVRVAEGESGYFTIKGKTEGFSRAEYEYKLPLKEAEELLQQFCEGIITKTRYTIKVNEKMWEVDEFAGDNEGLILAEIELSGESETFVLPDWIEEEVTGDERFYNSYLSVNSYKNWK